MQVRAKKVYFRFAERSLFLHKISCVRQIESELSLRSLALFLHKISCVRMGLIRLIRLIPLNQSREEVIATSKLQEEIAQLVRIIMEKIHGGQDCEAEQQKVNQIVSTLYI